MTTQRQKQFIIVKQRLSAQQAAISKVLKAGKLPLPEDVDAFAATSRVMAQLGQPVWKSAMDRFTDQVKELEKAMAANDPEAIQQAFEAVTQCKLSCHKVFRTGH